MLLSHAAQLPEPYQLLAGLLASTAKPYGIATATTSPPASLVVVGGCGNTERPRQDLAVRLHAQALRLAEQG